MSLLNILSQNNWFLYNKTLAKHLSVECAILVGFFSTEYTYYKKQDKLVNIDGHMCFYCTREKIYNETGLTETVSRKATKLLRETGILFFKKEGMPATNYYDINEEILQKYLESTEKSSSNKINEQVLLKDKDKSLEKISQVISNITSKQTNDSILDKSNIEYSVDTKKESKKDIELKENIKCIIDYLNESINSKFKYDNKQTIRDIKARFKEGYVLDDFYDVIDKKVKEWFNTEMEKYLRPSTLFGNKFENYINQKNSFNGKPKTSYSSKPSFDNTADHEVLKGVAEMTPEERADFEQNELARDENGNLMKF